jgi:hypothetical protein
MKNQEYFVLGVAILLAVGYGVISVKGVVSADGAAASLKAGLSNATSAQDSIPVASPWDNSPGRKYRSSSWNCPSWSMASVGVVPLRANHPLHNRPAFIGCNRHKVMCDGWNGWYYDNPGNEVL